jgi:hypothetical protein
MLELDDRHPALVTSQSALLTATSTSDLTCPNFFACLGDHECSTCEPQQCDGSQHGD